MSTKNTRGFTLVELIVVITILVILGTIAFMNMWSFSASARDSQRTSDLNQINSQIMTIQAKNGVLVTNMVTSGSTNQLTSPSIAGGSGTVGSTYQAWDVNYTILGIDSTKFRDPVSLTNYKMGATTLDGGVYELAATLEEVKKALVMGTFVKRTTSSTSSSGTVSNGIITITSNNLGVFRVGDILTLDATNTWSINSISADLKKITISNTTYSSGTTASYGIRADEVNGLIGSWSSSPTESVVNGSTIYLPY